MVYITAVRLRWGEGFEHIRRVRWTQPSVRTSGEASSMDVIRFIQHGGVVRVRDGVCELPVIVAHDHPPVLCTVADGRYSRRLLALPRF